MGKAHPRSDVRRFQPGDGPAIERLYRRALQTAGTDPDDVPGNGDLRLIGQTYLDTGGEFLIADGEDGIVACGGLLRDGPIAELIRITLIVYRCDRPKEDGRCENDLE